MVAGPRLNVAEVSGVRVTATSLSFRVSVIGMNSFFSKWILSHSTWYKNPRSRHTT